MQPDETPATSSAGFAPKPPDGAAGDPSKPAPNQNLPKPGPPASSLLLALFLAVVAPLIGLLAFAALLIVIVWNGLPPASVELVPHDVNIALDPPLERDGRVAVIQFVSADLRIDDVQVSILRNLSASADKAASAAGSSSTLWIGEARADQSQSSESRGSWPVAEPILSAEKGVFVTATSEPTVFKLGEAVYSGPFEAIPHLINVVLYPPADAKTGPRFLDAKATAEILAGGVKAALLKADALGARRALIVLAANPGAEGGIADRDDSVTAGAVRHIAPHLFDLRRVDIQTMRSAGDLGEPEKSVIGALTKILFTRLAPTAAESLAAVEAAPDAMISIVNPSNPPAKADAGILAATRLLSPRSSIAPLLIAFLVYCAVLTETGAQAAAAGWRYIPLDRQRSRLFSCIAFMPAALLAFNALTWSKYGASWSPDATQLANINAYPLLVYGLPVLAGLIAGGAVHFWAFDKTPPVAEPGSVSLRSILIRDIPVSGGAAADRLGFAQLVLSLARFIDNRDTVPPVVLAITGPWGSGKSSVMRMLEGELKPTGRFRFAWFNAWESQDRDKILAAFLRTIGRELRKQHGAGLALRIAWIRLSEASYWQLLTYALPLLLVAAGLAYWFSSGDKETVGLIGKVLEAMTGKDASAASSLTEIGALAAALTGLAGLANVARWLKPFQIPLSWMFASPDAGKAETSYLDQFRSEYTLYRKAVREDKFVVFVDDLDRCPPESVVEVLKAINLIITSDDGPGKTFFILGFDWPYVVSCIEMNFEKFIKANPETHGQFGRDYLKKIVTLPISVPQPASKQIREFLASHDKPESGERPQPSGWGGAIERITLVLSQPLVWFGLTIFLVLSALPQQLPVATQKADTEKGGAVTEPPSPVPSPSGDVIALDLPVVPPVPAWSGWLQWAVLLAALAIAGVAIARLRRVSENAAAHPEPADPPEFLAAVKNLGDSMPKNPRDVIRLLNLMRVTYFLQQPLPNRADIFTPPTLTPEQSVALSLLHYRDPGLLDRENLGKAAAAGGLSVGARGVWARKIGKTLSEVPAARAVFGTASGINRFIEIYRNLLPARARPE